LLPDVPTVREASFPTLEAEEWFGVLLPAQTPAAGVDRLNRAVRAITTSDGYKASLAKLSIKPADETPSEFFANHQIGIRPLGTDRAGVRLSSGRLAR
jgi:tripartite-type tricarboxylate transporter receptor subunit TctC